MNSSDNTNIALPSPTTTTLKTKHKWECGHNKSTGLSRKCMDCRAEEIWSRYEDPTYYNWGLQKGNSSPLGAETFEPKKPALAVSKPFNQS
jgi:hypothetical protein